MVTTTPDLVFELVIILNIFLYHSIIVHPSHSCIHLTLVLIFRNFDSNHVPFVFNLPP